MSASLYTQLPIPGLNDHRNKRAKVVQSLGYLNTTYRPAQASVVNSGHHRQHRPLRRPEEKSYRMPCIDKLPNVQRMRSYIPGADNGPENWGKIKPEWANCSVGRMQSPIDLSDERAKLVPSLGYLNTSYRPAEATIVNTGHYVMVSFKGDAGSLVINGTTYNLKQLHWHTPSEHTNDGCRYDLELHLVHQSLANKTAVIGILYEIGAIKDPFLHKLEPSIMRIKNTRDQPEDIGMVDPNDARGSDSVYYRYMGSLTTPPCTEDVVWTVFKEISPVAEYQVKLLRDALQDGNTMNARPLQEVNDRDISIFRPKPYDYY